MKKIILLVGDTGAGKDFVLSVANEYESIQVIKRFISRDARAGEFGAISSIFSVPICDIKKMDYYYEGTEAGKWYGIRKIDLDVALKSNKSPIVVCSNYQNYLQMLNDYPDNVVPFFIYRGYDDSELNTWRNSLIERGSSLAEIVAREKNKDKYFKELYIEHYFDYGSNVILNLYGITTREDIKLQIEGLCWKNDIDIDFIQTSKLKR